MPKYIRFIKKIADNEKSIPIIYINDIELKGNLSRKTGLRTNMGFYGWSLRMGRCQDFCIV
ncbi:hypothetical protein GCM10027035_40040 [Emticicia sediminis]